MYGILLAFKDYKFNLGIIGSPFIGFKYFEEFLTSPEFWRVLKNTVTISGLKILFCFPAPIILALCLNELRNAKFKKIVQTVSYLPNFVSWVVVVGLMNAFLSPYGGLINNLTYELFGADPVFFMGEKNLFYPLVISSDIWKGVGWGSIIYLSALTGVSAEQIEAAQIDGAGRLRIVWSIMLTHIKPTIGLMFIMAIGGILNAGFDQILLLQQPGNREISQILDTYVLNTGIKYGRFSYATAVGVFKSIFALILMVTTNYVSKKTMDVAMF